MILFGYIIHEIIITVLQVSSQDSTSTTIQRPVDSSDDDNALPPPPLRHHSTTVEMVRMCTCVASYIIIIYNDYNIIMLPVCVLGHVRS